MERLAFDMNSVYQRYQQVVSETSDQRVTREEFISAQSRDWSGFVWEYGFREKLRWTPYIHNFYYQQNQEGKWVLVDEDDLKSGVDFSRRIDSQERKGLVLENFLNFKDAIAEANDGDTLLSSSPRKSEDDTDCSFTYSFLYKATVKEAGGGRKVVEVRDFVNDLYKEDFINLFNQISKSETLSRGSTIDQLVATIIKSSPQLSDQDIWKLLISSKTEKKWDKDSKDKLFGKTLNQIVNNQNQELLEKIKQGSFREAEWLFEQLAKGVPVQILQNMVGSRLLAFVLDLSGGYRDFASISFEGSCGGLTLSSENPYFKIDIYSGEVVCRICKRKRMFGARYCCKVC